MTSMPFNTKRWLYQSEGSIRAKAELDKASIRAKVEIDDDVHAVQHKAKVVSERRQYQSEG